MSKFYQMGINSKNKKVLKTEIEYLKQEEDCPIVKCRNNFFLKLLQKI